MNDTRTTEADTTPAAVVETDPHLAQAARLKAQAEQIRHTARTAAADAEQQLTAARIEADRLVREAINAHNAAVSAALTADRRAQDVDGVAGYHRAAASTAAQIADLEARLADLDDEHADLTARLDGLSGRLAQVAVEQQAGRLAVDTALDQDDAEAVAANRAKNAALDEITGGLTAKAAAIRQRLAAIGQRADIEHGTAELPTALRRLEQLRADEVRVLDALDPTRPGAEQRAAAAEMLRLLAYAAAHPQAPSYTKQHTTVTSRGDGTHRADIQRT